MYRRYRERRHYRRRREGYYSRGNFLTTVLRRPSTQIGILVIAGLIIYLILQAGAARNSSAATSLPKEITVSEAFSKYQNGAFVLDVRTQEEWNQFHIPNSTLIPLDQLASRLGELPNDREIVVVCRASDCSQQGRDVLLNAGINRVSSMNSGLNDWRASGYPTQP